MNISEKPHYAWVICTGCCLLLCCTAGLTMAAYGVYQPYVIVNGGLTNTQGSLLMTARSLAALFSTVCVLKVYSKTGVRVGVFLAALLAAMAFFVFSLAYNFPTYCIAAAMAGAAFGLGGMVPVGILIGRWFHKNRALALGIAAAGTGIASIFAPPIITVFIEKAGLHAAFRYEAIFIVAIAIIVLLLLRNDPQDMGTEQYGAGATLEDKKKLQKSAPLLPRTGQIAMIFAIFLLGTSTEPPYSHLSMLLSTNSFDAVTISYVLSVGGILVTVGKLLYGRITDKMGAQKSTTVVFSALILGLALNSLAGMSSVPLAFIAVICMGIGLSLSTVAIPVLAADMSSAEEYPAMIRTYQTTFMVGSLVFSLVPGAFADMTGSYVPAYITTAILASISMILVQQSYRGIEKAKIRVGGVDAIDGLSK